MDVWILVADANCSLFFEFLKNFSLEPCDPSRIFKLLNVVYTLENLKFIFQRLLLDASFFFDSCRKPFIMVGVMSKLTLLLGLNKSRILEGQKLAEISEVC